MLVDNQTATVFILGWGQFLRGPVIYHRIKRSYHSRASYSVAQKDPVAFGIILARRASNQDVGY